MKLQHLIIIFLVIMLPMALIMSQYTGLQIDTLLTKNKYDTALLSATFDTMSAFEINTINSDASSIVGEEIRDIEAIISTFSTSLASSMGKSVTSKDEILSYVPAMVFGMYDGFYIYAQDDTGSKKELKPYVYYTKTYTNGSSVNLTISYSLDNYVSIYGTYGVNKTISKAGYLVVPEDVTASPDFKYDTNRDASGKAIIGKDGRIMKKVTSGTVKYKGYNISSETIYENETKENEEGILINQPEETTEAMIYYYEAKQFTELYNTVIKELNINDQNNLYINKNNDPENENSPFMNEKVKVMRDSITKSLNTAIYNYGGAVADNYDMPQLTGEDWDKILNNISITVFLKDIPIGSTRYNNYVIVNSTKNKKYNSAKSIDFIGYDSSGNSLGTYHKINCDELIKSVENGTASSIIGYASVDFKRNRYSPKEDSSEYYYYYKHNEYACYDCEVESIASKNVATVEEYIKSKTSDTSTQNKILSSYYTAVGRIRYRLVKASSYINIE